MLLALLLAPLSDAAPESEPDDDQDEAVSTLLVVPLSWRRGSSAACAADAERA